MMPPFILITIFLLILIGLIFSIYAFKVQKKHHRRADYYNFFMMGIIWLGAGIPLKMYPLSAMGLIFMILGLSHKKDWKKNHLDWTDLSDEEKKMRWWLIGFLLFALVAGVLVFYLTAGGGLVES